MSTFLYTIVKMVVASKWVWVSFLTDLPFFLPAVHLFGSKLPLIHAIDPPREGAVELSYNVINNDEDFQSSFCSWKVINHLKSGSIWLNKRHNLLWPNTHTQYCIRPTHKQNRQQDCTKDDMPVYLLTFHWTAVSLPPMAQCLCAWAE